LLRFGQNHQTELNDNTDNQGFDNKGIGLYKTWIFLNRAF